MARPKKKNRPDTTGAVGPQRFRVQRRREISARDAGNNPFLIGEFWDTVAQAGTRAAAEQVFAALHHDRDRGLVRGIAPGTPLRLVEARPEGLSERVIIPPK